jgi:hypothetical protein
MTGPISWDDGAARWARALKAQEKLAERREREQRG